VTRSGQAYGGAFQKSVPALSKGQGHPAMSSASRQLEARLITVKFTGL
jgi:hypothetical protein